MKTALIFSIGAVLIFIGVYCYYLAIGGAPLEELLNQAVGLPAKEEGGNGLPIVVSVVPYIVIIAVLAAVGILLCFVRRKRGGSLQR